MPALAFGVASIGHAFPRVYVAFGDDAVDVHALASRVDLGVSADVFAEPTLNAFLALGRGAWTSVQGRITDALDDAPRVSRRDLTMHMPIAVGDYVDMYAGIHHATNLGRLFRPDGEPRLPNRRRMPEGYHGRAA
jgi:fumarylacetoacetase